MKKSILAFGMFLFSVGTLIGCNKSLENFEDGITLENVDSAQNIINGQAVGNWDPMSFSTVALYIQHPQFAGASSIKDYCTGTLISKDIVLTAAHCFADFAESVGTSISDIVAKSSVGFGIPTVQKTADRRVVFRNIRSVKIHEKYVVNSVHKATKIPLHDIALVKLASPAPVSARVARIVSNPNSLQKGLTVTLVGFGLVNAIRQIDAQQMMKVDVQVEDPALTSTQFTYKVKGGRSACSGDSGGPAYIKTNLGEVAVIGVTSWGDHLCSEIGAYTSVPALSSWIQQNAAMMY